MDEPMNTREGEHSGYRKRYIYWGPFKLFALIEFNEEN